MKVIKGDLLELAKHRQFDVIIHGCNCFNVMSKGIAKQIKTAFPEAYLADIKTIKGDRKKLGNYSMATATIDIDDIETDLIIVNGYTQYHYGGRRKNADYKAIRLLFKKIKKDFRRKRIGFPKIGAGLAGGNWKIISKIIDKELEGEDFTFVEYVP